MSKRVLVLGAGGFVGMHLLTALEFYLPDVEVIATSKQARLGGPSPRCLCLDVTDRTAVMRFIDEVRPTHCIYLAGVASPRDAEHDLTLAWDVHFHALVDLARHLIATRPATWLISVGSGQVYGEGGPLNRVFTEQDALHPLDEYAASKAAADVTLGMLSRRGLRCVRLRPFNHTGPGQTDKFAIPHFAKQIAAVELGLRRNVVVGDLGGVRDVTDVRDVAACYAAVVDKSDTLLPGIVLNVSSGKGVRMRDLLRRMIELSGVKCEVVEQHPSSTSSSIKSLVGLSSAAESLVGWHPSYDIDGTLSDVLNEWRQAVALDRDEQR